ncbi:hypothetical protein IWQ62_000902 [Dispira parvispora]|uniref:Major facilitator superfamily (MFS) profile domain-containing protein n=1 Tax=Dispira parvispora TaxID=1520584 RepID=A0A9W8E4H7_9FUNG|nr:hypothetical protein IWQ62_000902 [Dispira parvispora]
MGADTTSLLSSDSKHGINGMNHSLDEAVVITDEKSHTANLLSPAVVDERRLVSKLDRYIVPIMTLTYILSFLDRSNIGNAKLMHLEKDLDISQAGYSWGLSIFFVGYILLEVPANIVMKLWRPSQWLGLIVFGWGVLCTCMAANTGLVSLLTLRFLLGAFEAGFVPGVIYYFTLWYTPDEICSRIGWLFTAVPVAGACGGLLAYAVSFMDGLHGIAAWQWLFLIEGLPTVVMGIIIFFFMPNSAYQASWLTPEEQQRVQQRLERRHGVDASTQGLNKAQVREAFKEFTTYIYGACLFGFGTAAYGNSFLMSTVIKELGFNDIIAQLLTVPPYVGAAIYMVLMCYHAGRVHKFGLHIIVSAAGGLVGFILIAFVHGRVGQYLSLTLAVITIFTGAPLLMGWMSNNTVGSTKIAVVTSLITSIGNLGGLVAGQMYRNSEAPQYLVSHLVNAGCLLSAIILVLWLCYIYTEKNKRLETESLANGKPFRYTL